MLELEENKHKLISLKEKIDCIESALNICGMEAEIKKLEDKTSEPNFWDDQQNSSSILTKMKQLQNKVEKFKKIEEEYEINQLFDRILTNKSGINPALGKYIFRCSAVKRQSAYEEIKDVNPNYELGADIDKIFSNTASTVDNAAKDIKTKNRLPHTLPPGRLLNIFGNVINIRLFPLSTCTP